MKFLLIKSNKTAILGLLAYLDMINHHNIVTKCARFLYLQNLQQNWKGSSNCTKTIIHLRPGNAQCRKIPLTLFLEYSTLIFTLPSVNNWLLSTLLEQYMYVRQKNLKVIIFLYCTK